jgi:hypothetical protein
MSFKGTGLPQITKYLVGVEKIGKHIVNMFSCLETVWDDSLNYLACSRST